MKRVLIIVCLSAALVACSANPRVDDLDVVRPQPPAPVVVWDGLTWQATTPELPAKISVEQWDQAVAVAAGPSGYVVVGSNSDVMGYVGRIWHSADSIGWTLEEHDFSIGLELVDVAANAETFIAIGTRTGNPNDPVAVILSSPDGSNWSEVSTTAGAWASRVATSPAGFAVILQVDESTQMLVSRDGRDWAPAGSDGMAADTWIADVAWDREGWLAVGSAGDHAVAYRSADGQSWSEDRLPASGPVAGIIDVSAYQVVPGRWATLILGLDREPSCAEDDDWCGKYQVTWSWTAESGWTRLPKANWINDRGYGVEVFPAGDAGFLYLGEEVRLSADGWDWNPVSEDPPSDALTADAVVEGDRVVAVGVPLGADEELVGWFGSGLITR